MLADRRVKGRRVHGAIWFLVLALALNALSGCTAVAGGGVVAVLVGISALTSHCYDYLDVTVLDAQGRKTCAATVTASRDNSSEHFELESCYYTPLTDGHWTLRASMPGSTDALSAVVVEHKDDCTRHVESVELTLNAAGTVRSSAPALPASTQSPPPPLVPSAASVPPHAITPTMAPAAPVVGGAGGAPNSPAPSAAGATSIGVFPNQTEPSR